MEQPPGESAVPDDDEVSRLRREVEQLRSEVSSGPPDTPASRTRTGFWRPVVAGVLILVGALLAPLAIVAVWAHDEIGDTGRYVETVTPLASNPAVQDAIVDRVTAEVFKRLDVKAVTQSAVDALAARGLPARAATSLGALATPLSNAVKSFVHDEVTKLVRSSQFEDAWVIANRHAHTQMVAVLTGETGSTVQVKGDTVQVNLAALIDAVKQRLVDRGFTLADKLPAVNAEFTILESVDLTRAQRAFRILDKAANTLPWLSLILLGLAVGVSRSRRRAIVVASLSVVGAMLLLGVALNVFREIYLDAIPPAQLSAAAAAAVYDALVHFIRLNLRAVLVLFLAIAAIAWAGGPASAPSAVRRGTGRVIDVVRHGSDRAGFNTGRLGTALDEYRTPLRVAVLGVALLVYVLAAHPTGTFTLVVLGCALLVLLVIELLARPPAPSSTS